MSCDHELANDRARCREKNARYITMVMFFVFGLSVQCLKFVPSAAVVWSHGYGRDKAISSCITLVVLSLRLQLFEGIELVRDILLMQLSPI